MPMSEAQRRVPPLAKGTAYVPWWMSTAGHKAVTPAEMRAWVAKVEAEQGQAKAQIEKRREEAKLERKRIK